jgi:hypothetical protein
MGALPPAALPPTVASQPAVLPLQAPNSLRAVPTNLHCSNRDISHPLGASSVATCCRGCTAHGCIAACCGVVATDGCSTFCRGCIAHRCIASISCVAAHGCIASRSVTSWCIATHRSIAAHRGVTAGWCIATHRCNTPSSAVCATWLHPRTA